MTADCCCQHYTRLTAHLVQDACNAVPINSTHWLHKDYLELGHLRGFTGPASTMGSSSSSYCLPRLVAGNGRHEPGLMLGKTARRKNAVMTVRAHAKSAYLRLVRRRLRRIPPPRPITPSLLTLPSSNEVRQKRRLVSPR